MGIARELDRVSSSGQRFADTTVDAFRDFFKNSEKAAEAQIERNAQRVAERAEAAVRAERIASLRQQAAAIAARPAERGFWAGTRRLAFAPIRGAARAGLNVVDWTVGFGAKPARWAFDAGAAAFERFPKAAPVAAVLGLGVGVGSWLQHRSARAMQEERMMRLSEAQAMAQAAAPRAGQISLDDPDLARMNSLMRESNYGAVDSVVNHGDRILAGREAAAKAGATPVASSGDTSSLAAL